MNKKKLIFFTVLFTAVCAFSLERLNVGAYLSNTSNIHFRFDCYDDNSIRITDDAKVQVVLWLPDMNTMLNASLLLAEFFDDEKIVSVMQLLKFFEEEEVKYEYKQFSTSKNYYIDSKAFTEEIVREIKKNSRDNNSSSKSSSSSTSNNSANKSANNNSANSNPNRLVVWSFTNEIQVMAENYYKPDHPNVEVEYSYIVTDQFQKKLDPVLASGNGVPDVFALEDAFVCKYVEQGDKFLLDLTDEYNAIKGKMIPYPAEVATHNGRVYAVSWQACPGALFYRRSLAKKYLGTDDPAEVQKFVKDWKTFLATARSMRDASNGKCVILSTTGDLFKPYQGARKNPWVVNGKLNIDQAMIDYMKMCKIMKDEGLAGPVGQWSEEWFDGMKGDLRNYDGETFEVFSYFLPTWGLHYVLKINAGSTAGDWAMCQGPAPYRWGGTWIAAYKGTKTPARAKEFLMYLCTDDKSLERWAKDTGDMVSSNKAINKIKNTYSEPFLGGQNHYAEFAKIANNVNGSLTQKTDQVIEGFFGEATGAYINGECSLEQALAEFKKWVAEELGF